jgi:hypothetical protein
MVKPKTAPFEFQKVLHEEAAGIERALREARVVLGDRDIDAAGHHIEDSVRRVIGARLPPALQVGKGHVVDSRWTSSPEFDLIVAETSSSPILFTASDGTQYFPYESVYAVGEIKARYRRSDRQIHRFVESLTALRDRLHRDPTPKSFVPGLGSTPFLTTKGWPFRNPLFAFMFFAEAGDFDYAHIRDVYEGTAWRYLPIAICFLDLGLLQMFVIGEGPNGEPTLGSFVPVPEFEPASRKYAWILAKLGPEGFRAGGNLAGLVLALTTHISRTVLMPPKLLDYLTSAGLMSIPTGGGQFATRIAGDGPPNEVP